MNRTMMVAIAVVVAVGLPAWAAEVTPDQLDKAFANPGHLQDWHGHG